MLQAANHNPPAYHLTPGRNASHQPIGWFMGPTRVRKEVKEGEERGGGIISDDNMVSNIPHPLHPQSPAEHQPYPAAGDNNTMLLSPPWQASPVSITGDVAHCSG